MLYLEGGESFKPMLRNDELHIQLWINDPLPGLKDGQVVSGVEFTSFAHGVVCFDPTTFYFIGDVSAIVP